MDCDYCGDNVAAAFESASDYRRVQFFDLVKLMETETPRFQFLDEDDEEGDPDSTYILVRGRVACIDCCLEILCGVLPRLWHWPANAGHNGPLDRDGASPGQENAIRAMEDG